MLWISPEMPTREFRTEKRDILVSEACSNLFFSVPSTLMVYEVVESLSWLYPAEKIKTNNRRSVKCKNFVCIEIGDIVCCLIYRWSSICKNLFKPGRVFHPVTPFAILVNKVIMQPRQFVCHFY